MVKGITKSMFTQKILINRDTHTTYMYTTVLDLSSHYLLSHPAPQQGFPQNNDKIKNIGSPNTVVSKQ